MLGPLHARGSGVVGVAAVTAGPGITNTVTAVKNAQMAQSPLLLLGGAAATNLRGRGSLQVGKGGDREQAIVQSCCWTARYFSTLLSLVFLSFAFAFAFAQDVDQLGVLRSVVKFSARAARVRDIVPALREALREARAGVPGPVFVELPLDVLYPIGEVLAGMALVQRARLREVGNAPQPHRTAPRQRQRKRPVASEGRMRRV